MARNFEVGKHKELPEFVPTRNAEKGNGRVQEPLDRKKTSL
jgi:hypothetical protein